LAEVLGLSKRVACRLPAPQNGDSGAQCDGDGRGCRCAAAAVLWSAANDEGLLVPALPHDLVRPAVQPQRNQVSFPLSLYSCPLTGPTTTGPRRGHYDPSGPLHHEGRWHVFPDGGNHSKWSHYSSTDLLRWTKQSEASPVLMVGAHDTGSVSVTEAGIIALFPGSGDIVRQVKDSTAVPDGGVDWLWGATEKPPAATRPTALGKGFRDPSRALKMPDGNYYVAVGSGFGGTGPNSNNNTGLPDSGTGCMAWMRATDPTLSNLSFVGCLMENSHTTGHIDPSTIAWNSTDMTAAFIECPDIFPLVRKRSAFLAIYA
jgi:hypothetical protein